MLEGRIDIHRECYRLEKWAREKLKVQQGRARGPAPRSMQPDISADWVMNGLTAALWRRAWGTPVVEKLEMSCQCVPTIQRANCTLAASRLSVTSRLREVILVLLLWDPSWRSVSSFWPTSARKTCTCLSESRERPKNYQCAATPLLWTKAERAGVCLAWGRDLTASILSLKWAYKRDGARIYHIL